MKEAQKQASLENQVQTIVKVKPGSSSEKGAMFILPVEKANASLSEVIKYALAQDDTRKNERIVNRLNNELSKSYGITVNGKVANASDKIEGYLTSRKLDDGTDYNELEIVVASKQEGGAYLI